MGLFSASGSCWHEPLLFLGRRAVVPLSESFQISFAIVMAPTRRRPSKGIGKGGTHSNVGSTAPLLGATSSTAARDGPTTRSSPGAAATTLGSLVEAGENALVNTRAADTASDNA